MAAITKVALAGATGNVGPSVLEQLLSAGFQVTVLIRKEGKRDFPSSVSIKDVDYGSLDSLVAALEGQDALVSTLGSAALANQLLLVEAAAKAKVKRFIPSEFGSNTVHPRTKELPVFGDKVAVQDALKKEVSSSGMSYTLVIGGPLLDWGMRVGFVLNIREKSIVLYDGGERTFSTTTLKTYGKAIAGVLKHPEETKNRPVYIQDTAKSLKQLEDVAKKATTSEDWTETVDSTEDALARGYAEMKKDNPNPMLFSMDFLRAAIWGEGYGSLFEKTDNELLGITEMSDAELQEVANKCAQ